MSKPWRCLNHPLDFLLNFDGGNPRVGGKTQEHPDYYMLLLIHFCKRNYPKQIYNQSYNRDKTYRIRYTLNRNTIFGKYSPTAINTNGNHYSNPTSEGLKQQLNKHIVTPLGKRKGLVSAMNERRREYIPLKNEHDI